MRRAVLLAGVALAVMVSSADARFPWTHRLTISGQFVNHWTVSDPTQCGTNGDGSVTVSFKSSKSIHTLVTRERGTRHWLLVGLYGSFHQTTFLPPQPATATITTVDNTAPANPAPGDSCLPIDKTGCGTMQFRKPTVKLSGEDAKRLNFNLFSDNFGKPGCQFGSVTRFGDVDFFGHRTPELLITMPSPRSFFRKRTVTLTGTSHDNRSLPDLDATITNDVTRTVTLTFTKR
jgi:hypothetical protein